MAMTARVRVGGRERWTSSGQREGIVTKMERRFRGVVGKGRSGDGLADGRGGDYKGNI
jgi:hypothetical protein